MTDSTPEHTPETPDDEALEPTPKQFDTPLWGDGTAIDISSLVSTPEDLVDSFRTKVINALDSRALGEKVAFSVGLSTVPQQQGFVPVLVLVVAMPSLVIGQKVFNTALIPNLEITQEATDETVHGLLEGMREARSRMANGQGNG